MSPPTCPYNLLNFSLLVAEIISLVWGTPANFNGFRVLAALLHGTLVVGVSQSLRRWKRAPPIVGRAAITLGIVPDSSYHYYCGVVSAWNTPQLFWCVLSRIDLWVTCELYSTVLYCTVLYRAVLIMPCHLCLVLCNCVVLSTQCTQLTECFLPITAVSLQFLNLTFVFVSAFVCARDAKIVYSMFMCVFDPGLCCLIGFVLSFGFWASLRNQLFTFVAWNSCFAGQKCNTATKWVYGRKTLIWRVLSFCRWIQTSFVTK